MNDGHNQLKDLNFYCPNRRDGKNKKKKKSVENKEGRGGWRKVLQIGSISGFCGGRKLDDEGGGGRMRREKGMEKYIYILG